MQLLGKFFRSFLNINTIWGLMILTAFFLCVYHHYMPYATAIATDCFGEGENNVTIRITDNVGETRDFQYQLPMRSGQLNIDPADSHPGHEAPWLISIRKYDAGYLLKWDCTAYGQYVLAVGDNVVDKDQLVTVQSLTDAALEYAKGGFDIALGLISSMVLFLGLMKVGVDAGIVQLVAKVFYPIIRFLFPDVPKGHPANGAILMNWTTTLLGLGNAATPFGLKAMKELQSLNPHPEIASDSQVMLLGYNTAGLALLPTTLLAVRKSAGCSDPFEIIGTCMFAGFVATVTAIVMVKLLGKLPVFSMKAAVAEQIKDTQASDAKQAATQAEGGDK